MDFLKQKIQHDCETCCNIFCRSQSSISAPLESRFITVRNFWKLGTMWDLRGDLIRKVVNKGPIILSIATFSSSLFHVIITVEYKVIAASVPLEVY